MRFRKSSCFLALTFCAVLVFAILCLKSWFNEALVTQAKCRLIDVADPASCGTCGFDVEATAVGSQKVFVARNWILGTEYDYWTDRLAVTGAMFACCPDDPIDCCSFIQDGVGCDVRGGGKCPSVPWDCTLNMKADDEGAGDIPADKLIIAPSISATLIYAICAAIFLVVCLILLYIVFCWGAISMVAGTVMSLIDAVQIRWELFKRRGIQWECELFIKSLHPIVIRDKISAALEERRRRKREKRERILWEKQQENADFLKRAKAIATIQRWVRQFLARRALERNFSYKKLAIEECQKGLLKPKEIQWRYLWDTTPSYACGHRVTVARIFYVPGCRVETLTILVANCGPDDTLKLSFDDYIEEDIEGSEKFPSLARRPCVSRVKGLLARQGVTPKHALRSVDGKLLEMRDDDIDARIKSLRKRWVDAKVLVFIRIAKEWRGKGREKGGNVASMPQQAQQRLPSLPCKASDNPAQVPQKIEFRATRYTNIIDVE